MGGRSLDKNFFSQSEHVSSQIWCQKFFPLLGGGGVPQQKFFFWGEHVSSQIWCQKIFPLLKPGTPPGPETRYPPCSTPPDLKLGTPLTWDPPTWTWTWDPPTWTWDPPTWTWDPPYLDLDLGSPPPGPGTPPTWTWTWDPPEQTHTCENITSRRTYVRGR